MTNVFFSSDHHFGHARILEFCGDTRQGQTVEEHDEILIEAHNNVVKPQDTVWMLGDECLGDRKKGYANIRRMNGHKRLLRGNHTVLKDEHKSVFMSIDDYKEIRLEGIKVCMMHFPLLSWNQMGHGAFMLHGHCHASLKDIGGKMLDVGIDTRPNKDMKPWSWEEVKEYMSKRDILNCDHHNERTT